MATQTGTAAQATTAGSTMTAQRVIEIFASLGLPVCDDSARIAEAKKKYSPRYLRDRSSPDQAVAARAAEWFANVDLLGRKLSDLLEIVYTECRNQNDLAIHSFIASGTTTVTQEMLAALRKSIESFKTESILTDQFLERYLRERGLKRGVGLVDIDPVADLLAVSRLGRIELTWKKPAANFESLEIERQEVGTKQIDSVYKGTGISFTDTGAKVGKWYTYRAYSINKTARSTDAVVAREERVVCLGEVSNQRGELQTDRVHLTWDRPAADTGVVIYRRNGKKPEIRGGGGRPVPESMATQLVFEGAGTAWDDTTVVEGNTYHYLLVAKFGATLFSQGVTTQVTIPKAPPATACLAATFQGQGTRNNVALEWPAVPEAAGVMYVLMRREGATPAAAPGKDAIVETRQLRHVDETVKPGRRYSYSLFTRQGDLYSRTGSVAPAVDILPEVSDVNITTGDGTVEVSWTAPKEAAGVVVRRRLEPPQNAFDGHQLSYTGTSSARDENIVNGRTYHYLVCAVYRPDGQKDVFSRGVRRSAMPARLPDPVQRLKTGAINLQVTCSWSSADYRGTIAVYRSAQNHGRLVGERLDLAGLDALIKEIAGEPITVNQDTAAVDTNPQLEKPYYSSFTIAGAHCVVGAVSHCVANPDVAKLQLIPTRDGIILRWEWPKDCNAVTVSRKKGDWPLGFDDRQATHVKVSLKEYQDAGEKYKQTLRGKGGHFFYVIYARAAASFGTVHAAGSSQGSRADIVWQPWLSLKYSLPRGKENRDGNTMRLVWKIEDLDPEFAGFLLLADLNSIPVSADNGIELFRWVPENGNAVTGGESKISLAPVLREGWPHFYCKVMLIDPLQAATTLVIHPDVCEMISPSWESASKLKIIPIDFAKTPKNAICPFCLDEFPIDKIKFRPGAGGEPIAGGRSLWARLRNRPITPPKALIKGNPKKACPKCKEELHTSAGVQEDLVIGMVGAKYSGKSHYVASLVHRLEGRGSTDMYSAMMPLGDHTIHRYKQEFYHPLFEDRLELAATADVPPPLVYDLAFSGQLWQEEYGRSVTLALYDTAGENFDSQELVRQMVKYLRVASGIIFLVDPLQSKGIQQFLPTDLRNSEQDEKADPHTIISRVIQELVNNNVLGVKEPLNKPVAMVMTKCDVLQQCGLIPENRLWTMDQRHLGKFRRDIHEDMSGMIGELLQLTNLPAYQAVKMRFPRHAFFGVSSTGCAPNKKGRFPFIAPWRVVDPLFWLLSELGVIPREDLWTDEGKAPEKSQ